MQMNEKQRIETAETINVAYLLLVHNNPEQLNMFLRQILSYGKGDIYIHVDKKNQKMVKELITDDRITVISKYEVKWASFEMMAATIDLMKLAADSGRPYTHVYYGSGNDLLVKKGMYEHLAGHPGELFMQIHGEIGPREPYAARYRIRWSSKLMVRDNFHPYRFVRWFYHIMFRFGIVLNENKVPIEFKHIYRGSQWFVIPMEAMRYCVDYIGAHPEYLEYWRQTLAPDEFLFQTIILNSPYREKVKPSLMYLRITNDLINHNQPETITSEKIGEIEASGCFCARKFDLGTDRAVIEHFLDATAV